MLDDTLRQDIHDAVLCWLATASADGVPSCSPKEIFTDYGERELLIANIASPRSAKQITENPRACVSLIDIFTQRGHQLFGSAELVAANDERFADLSAPLLELTQGLFPFGSLFRIEIERVRPIVAPRYALYPGTTEAQQTRAAMRRYRVRPA